MAPALPKKSYARIPVTLDLPNLIEVQIESFKNLKREGLESLFREISPIQSYNEKMQLYFPSDSAEAREWGLEYRFDEPKYNIAECVERDLTYASPLYVSVLLAGQAISDYKRCFPFRSSIF